MRAAVRGKPAVTWVLVIALAVGVLPGAQPPVVSVINIHSQPGQGVNSRQSTRQSDQTEHPWYKCILVDRDHSDSYKTGELSKVLNLILPQDLLICQVCGHCITKLISIEHKFLKVFLG